MSIDLVVILYRKNNLLSHNFAMVELSWQYKIYEDCKHYAISLHCHADKCFTIHLSKKRKTAEFNYSTQPHTRGYQRQQIPWSYIQLRLSWTSHINNISAKANHTIGFLRRNIHSCPKEVKAAAYTTLVWPSIEYASSVWDPYTRNNIHQLEAIQRRAARFVYNNFYDREPGVVTSMISRSQWESLERRAKARATFMYKIVNNLVDVHAEHILTPSNNRTRGNAAYRTLYTNLEMLMYIDILSSRVPSSPGTPYHQFYVVKSTPLTSSRQG